MVLHCSFAYEGERGERGDCSRGLRLRDEIKPAGNKIQHHRLVRGELLGWNIVYFSPVMLSQNPCGLSEKMKSHLVVIYTFTTRTSHQHTPHHNT